MAAGGGCSKVTQRVAKLNKATDQTANITVIGNHETEPVGEAAYDRARHGKGDGDGGASSRRAATGLYLGAFSRSGATKKRTPKRAKKSKRTTTVPTETERSRKIRKGSRGSALISSTAMKSPMSSRPRPIRVRVPEVIHPQLWALIRQ